MRNVMKNMVLPMAALALLEDLANGAIRRERVFREREDLLANDDNWLISRFRIILEKIVLEQFVEGLPAATSDWVLCHRLADLAGAITLAEDHLAVLSRGRAHEGRPASPGGPTPALRRGPPPGSSRYGRSS
ncbi:hypothetical protein N1851_018759 [Merluccius polli]|uniref:SCAN box domain-containing protein n=1 Tax=Merluccius polli TaxID=89951 RepID=A0AA47MMN6_MERPO|nr:hypothetical protein N1851_018759 [Merluccius polli]